VKIEVASRGLKVVVVVGGDHDGDISGHGQVLTAIT